MLRVCLEQDMTKYNLCSIHLILAVLPGLMLQVPEKCGTADTGPVHSYVILLRALLQA